MQKLTIKQQDILNIIINKSDDWNTYFDQLFIELIPYAYAVAKKIDIQTYKHFIEWDDFLSYAFIVYNSMICHYQKIKQNNSENFLAIYGLYLYRMYRYIIKKYNELNGEKILSITVPEYQIIGFDEGRTNDLEKINHFCIDLNYFINEDEFFKKTFNLLKNGYSVTEVAKKLNVSRSNLYRKISAKKDEFKKHQKIY